MSDDPLDNDLLETEPRKIAERLKQEQNFNQYHDTPGHEFVPPSVTMGLPMVSFPESLEQYARQLDKKAWNLLTSQEQRYLSHLGAKLEPIVQVVPVIPGVTPVVGFECLGLGPEGENFGTILKSIPKNYPVILVKFLLAMAQVETAVTLRSAAMKQEGGTYQHLFFTINLEPDMLASEYMGEFFDRIDKHNILFEINEKTSDSTAVKVLKSIHNIRLVLDDWNSWENQEAAEELEAFAEWTKIDAGNSLEGAKNNGKMGFRNLMNKLGTWTPKKIIDSMKKWVLEGKPLVVEGVENKNDFRFLQTHWQKHSPERLYAQGYGVDPGPSWQAWLANLADFDLGGGFILANEFLAKATRKVMDSLPKNEQEHIQKEMKGPIFQLTIPADSHQKETLVLSVISPKTLQKELTPYITETSKLVVQNPIPDLLPGIQFTLKDLGGYLRLWYGRKTHAGMTLKSALRQDEYAMQYQPQEIDTKDESPKIEGRTFLINWLEAGRDSPPFCALLGDSGIGKTFLCREFAKKVINTRKNQPSKLPIPFYLDMRQLPPQKSWERPLLEYIIGFLSKMSGFGDIPVRSVLTAVRTGDVALIFDGFDEKAANMDIHDSSELLNEIRRAAPPKSDGKVLIACRTHYFKTQPDERVRVFRWLPSP